MVIVVIATLPTLLGYNIVIPTSEMMNDKVNGRLPKRKTGDTLQLFRSYDFSDGKWAAYLVVAADDRADIHPKLAGRTCWKTTDIAVLKEMQQRWTFKINSDADIATVTSTFYLIRDGVVVFDSGIVADSGTQGIQMREYGWMQPTDKQAVMDVLTKFKAVKWPVVFI
ncbi:hypothetical protein BC343_20575 [Mucilaginibacter pedocola]|uniref:Uncharacterized protein n=2 Tax=Mucilaginibacter pedocola TaxID=1792845 RepID=A0A1S9PK89_9SPHI|nr:hypothetical protein BC343_20575 [Mucilaginibacter pedocola]